MNDHKCSSRSALGALPGPDVCAPEIDRSAHPCVWNSSFGYPCLCITLPDSPVAEGDADDTIVILPPPDVCNSRLKVSYHDLCDFYWSRMKPKFRASSSSPWLRRDTKYIRLKTGAPQLSWRPSMPTTVSLSI